MNLTPVGMSEICIKMMTDLEMGNQEAMILLTDSQNAKITVLNKNNVAITSHIDIRYQCIINRLKMGPITVQQISTTKIIADGLKKPLMKINHARFVKLLGMIII